MGLHLDADPRRECRGAFGADDYEIKGADNE